MRVAKKANSQSASLPAPIGGWNARDALGEMAKDEAVYLTNWYPATSDVVQRLGYSQYATGLTGQVESLFSYSGAATNKLFACAGTALYDVTEGGAIASSTVSTLTNARFQYVNVATSGGNFLIATNGADLPLIYNGSGWDNWFPAAFDTTVTSITSVGTTATATMVSDHNLKTGMTVVIAGFTPAGYNGTYTITVTGAKTFTYTLSGALGVVTVIGTVTPLNNYAVTGVTLTGIVNINLHKNRVWLIENNSLNAWYLPTSAIAGAATAFPLQGIAQQGGYIVAMGTWTVDAGYGVDDLAVFITSKGEIIVYRGTDPSSANTWALVGVWRLGAPVGRRCLMKFAGDLLVVSQDGLLPLSSALQSSRVNPKVALTDKIQFATSEAISRYGSTFGWQTLYFPKENMLFLNVPVAVGSQQQYVMNTITKAWCNFTGWNANCWELYQDNPYFGGNGYVGLAWNTYADNGTNITADGKQAFNYFGAPGVLKRWTMIRPIITTNGSPSIAASLNIDYDDSQPNTSLSFSPSSYGVWDTGVWDTFVWGDGLSVLKNWQGVTGVGYSAALRLKSVSKSVDVHWVSCDFVMERGGVL